MTSNQQYTKTDLGPCEEWQKYRDKAGYGHRSFKGKHMLSHRVAWILANGEIPEGMCVLHKCDNPPCCNPNHLFLGTLNDNIQDCYSKGRISRAPRNTGVKHWKSEISELTAVRIKILKGLPGRIVMDALGMSRQGVWDIQNDRNWKHVTARTRYAF